MMIGTTKGVTGKVFLVGKRNNR